MPLIEHTKLTEQ